MARDSMQPWLDRISLGELEGTGVSPRSAFGWREWDGHDTALGALSYGRPENQDMPALPGRADSQVGDDSSEDALYDDDFDFTVASY